MSFTWIILKNVFWFNFVGYGGLSLSIEGPSKAEIKCKDNENGTLDISYRPTEPGYYIMNLKFADHHVDGSPFTIKVSAILVLRKLSNTHWMLMIFFGKGCWWRIQYSDGANQAWPRACATDRSWKQVPLGFQNPWRVFDGFGSHGHVA